MSDNKHIYKRGENMMGFFIGFMIGGTVGAVAMALVAGGSR